MFVKRNFYTLQKVINNFKLFLQASFISIFLSVLQSLLLSIAAGLLEAEAKHLVEDKESYLNEHCPPLNLPCSTQELQVQTQSQAKHKVELNLPKPKMCKTLVQVQQTHSITCIIQRQ